MCYTTWPLILQQNHKLFKILSLHQGDSVGALGKNKNKASNDIKNIEIWAWPAQSNKLISYILCLRICSGKIACLMPHLEEFWENQSRGKLPTLGLWLWCLHPGHSSEGCRKKHGQTVPHLLFSSYDCELRHLQWHSESFSLPTELFPSMVWSALLTNPASLWQCSCTPAV